jgi:hypothetical protein
VGTVIQDTQQRNAQGQPRWDRFERADLFEQYRELRTQGISERQAAQALKVPRSTLQAWRVWHDTLDICPPGRPYTNNRVMKRKVYVTPFRSMYCSLVCEFV